jgi:hypothetical protein
MRNEKTEEKKQHQLTMAQRHNRDYNSAQSI